jgi:hypothetical protein
VLGPKPDFARSKGLWIFEIQLPYTQPRNGVESGAILKAVDTLGLNTTPGTAPHPVTLPPAGSRSRPSSPRLLAAEGFVLSVGGQINFRGITLRNLINFGWELNDDQMIANPPKWFDEDKFDIVAKVAALDTSGAGGAPQFDGEDMPRMIRNLIEERFAIKWHMEDSPTDTYALVAETPKMKTADP